MRETLSPLFPGKQIGESGMDRLQPGETNHWFKELVHDSPVAIYSCDKQGYITFFNQAAATLWGRQPDCGKDRWCGSWKIY
jgi:PAS domain-containing protein